LAKRFKFSSRSTRVTPKKLLVNAYSRLVLALPHALRVNWNYQIPVGRGQRHGADMHPILNALVGGWSVNAGRKTAMLICAVSVVPIVFASQVSNLWMAVGLVGLAAAAHQGWSANLFTTVSDMFPRRAVGSVVGIGGMAGGGGGTGAP